MTQSADELKSAARWLSKKTWESAGSFAQHARAVTLFIHIQPQGASTRLRMHGRRRRRLRRRKASV
jgi:hypothetical protein